MSHSVMEVAAALKSQQENDNKNSFRVSALYNNKKNLNSGTKNISNSLGNNKALSNILLQWSKF